MNEGRALQITVSGLSADEHLEFERCLGDGDDNTGATRIAGQSRALLSEINDVAYTVIVTGFAVDYIASVIVRIRKNFAKCTVFDFRNNTLAVSHHEDAGELSGKCLIVASSGEVTVSNDAGAAEISSALKQLLNEG